MHNSRPRPSVPEVYITHCDLAHDGGLAVLALVSTEGVSRLSGRVAAFILAATATHGRRGWLSERSDKREQREREAKKGRKERR